MTWRNRIRSIPAGCRGPAGPGPSLSGRQARESEAEAFETHYLGCAKCREDVTTGAVLRELYGRPAVAASASRLWILRLGSPKVATSGRRRCDRLPCGRRVAGRAASAEQAGQPVLRGPGAGVLVLEVEAGPEGGIELSWPTHPGATAYEVQVFAADGTRCGAGNRTSPGCISGPASSSAPEPGKSLEVEVHALDAMRQVVASSEPISSLSAPR